ncbi:M48 family metallopeptidase [Actinophytocola algeriensis]|uniref:Zn-dependent protease with chaperone function n=1 Tax=Actinophytocola algeriensis TaxID=1768010 RepID=A0A7W7VFU0_9PSEU|nr:M48 family metallopeptidase [Actinophytocola algeriensis]MBB4908656.1 Zn-dependent protease with chaperone function [Actinophytocola algeriensis]MBE1474957.1 Zn-dependent protease with chaperone function [Actinophytocola algeriensis]
MLLTSFVPMAMLVVMGALVWFNIYAFTVSPVTAVKIAIGVVPTVLVLGRGLWVLASKIDNPVHGVPVREHEQPELWALVRRLAEVADTAPPDDIHLIADANAAVMEDTRLLGLISTRRHLFIGAPLIAEMSSAQFAAVLTHELAHYSNRDTRFAGIAYRSRRAYVHTLATMNRDDYLQRGLHFLLRHCGAVTLRASTKLSRRQESAADEAAAGAVGSAATVAAFRELAPIAESWQAFLDNHLVVGWTAGYLPADAFAGYRRLRASLHDQLGELRANPPDEADPYDTHPPMSERIAAIDALRAVGTVRVPPGPALGLLHNPVPLLDAALLDGLVPEARTKRRVDWPTLVRIGGLAALTEATGTVLANAARLTARPPSLRTLLDALDAGLLTELGATPPGPAGPGGPADGPRVRYERAKLIVRKGLFGAVVTTLTEAGAVRWQESWPSVGAMRLDERYRVALPELVDAAVSERPDTAGLRALLDAAGQITRKATPSWHSYWAPRPAS